MDVVTGNWTAPIVNSYLDRSNTEKPPPRRRHLDADGNENPITERDWDDAHPTSPAATAR